MNLSFQLYSSRNFPPVANQIAVLAALGYKKTRATIAVMEHDNPTSFTRFAENSAMGVAPLGVNSVDRV